MGHLRSPPPQLPLRGKAPGQKASFYWPSSYSLSGSLGGLWAGAVAEVQLPLRFLCNLLPSQLDSGTPAVIRGAGAYWRVGGSHRDSPEISDIKRLCIPTCVSPIPRFTHSFPESQPSPAPFPSPECPHKACRHTPAADSYSETGPL